MGNYRLSVGKGQERGLLTGQIFLQEDLFPRFSKGLARA